MTIAPISAGAASSTTPADKTQLAGTQNEFLKLFMAQLQHQDPLNPQSGTDMVAQLAQFSNVEAAQQTNAQLAALTAAQSSTASAGLSSLVGRTCDATAGDFQMTSTGGSPPPLAITSPNPMKGASVVITNADGKELRRIAIPAGSESTTINWDGKDASGKTLASGSYHVAIDSGTSTGAISASWHASVSGVDLSNGSLLRMGDILVSPGAISTIGQITTTSNLTGVQ
jgi:flagellar basal-body rod modification protein FlgD